MAENDSARGSGLRHGWVRTADGVYHDIDAIINMEGDVEIDDTNVEGDDSILANFASNPTASIKMKANSLRPALLAAISDGTVVPIMDGLTQIGEEIGGGTEGVANPPFVEIGGYTVAKRKSDGVSLTVQRIFHSAQLRLKKATQEKDGEFACEFEGIAYQTSTDIVGGALATNRVDTLRFSTADIDTLIAAQGEEPSVD